MLTVISNHYAYYIFNWDIVESVLRNNHMNECTEKFSADDGAIVLLDFINYYAMAYAYSKLGTDELSQVPVINKKILEMKKR